MSHCVQKYARRTQKKIILVSCHYDVIEWLDPDWIIDCNSQKFIDRRLLHSDERRRNEKIDLVIREVTASSWDRFSKYHYLSDGRVGGRVLHFGLFLKESGDQIGYNCLANYVPWTDKSKPMIMHVSRTVIHPDYAGFGLGIRLDNAVSSYGHHKLGYRVLAKFSSEPFFKMMSRDTKNWKHLKTERQIGRMSRGSSYRSRGQGGFRENVKTHTFEFVG